MQGDRPHKLDLDSIKIDSFQTSNIPLRGARGMVVGQTTGRPQTGHATCDGNTDCGSCFPDCPDWTNPDYPTCGVDDPTCNVADPTCGGAWTCTLDTGC
jgi:hypothetical protein